MARPPLPTDIARGGPGGLRPPCQHLSLILDYSDQGKAIDQVQAETRDPSYPTAKPCQPDIACGGSKGRCSPPVNILEVVFQNV